MDLRVGWTAAFLATWKAELCVWRSSLEITCCPGFKIVSSMRRAYADRYTVVLVADLFSHRFFYDPKMFQSGNFHRRNRKVISISRTLQQ